MNCAQPPAAGWVGAKRPGSVVFLKLALAAAALSWAGMTASVAAEPGARNAHNLAAASSAITIPPLGGWQLVSEQGPRWMSLTAQQREALGPLEEDWPGIDASRKTMWLSIAARFPAMGAIERQRMHERMTEWARLTPTQRGEARANFQQAARVVPQDRQAQWEAYKALSEAERKRLASQASAASQARAGTAAGRQKTELAKSNIVPNPTFASAPRAVSGTVMRAGPGAATSLVTKRPNPPAHQTPGLPKVAAMPELVDQATLLPQRGPQAATQPAPTISGDGAPAE